ncbi:unnamed protein product [Lota lota]
MQGTTRSLGRPIRRPFGPEGAGPEGAGLPPQGGRWLGDRGRQVLSGLHFSSACSRSSAGDGGVSLDGDTADLRRIRSDRLEGSTHGRAVKRELQAPPLPPAVSS